MTEELTDQLMNNSLNAHVVSHQPLTMEAKVFTWVSPCWICGGQSGTETGFSLSSSVFPSVSFCRGPPILIYHLGMNNRSVGGCT
jgi:hypothetical protein